MSTSIETIVFRRLCRRARLRSRLGDTPLIPLIILATIAFTAIFADVLAPHNPEVGSLTARFRPPFWQAGGSTDHVFGTDQLGRDVLSRLIFGARVSMVVGFTAVIFAGVVGTVLGIMAGYLGGWVDHPHRPARPHRARLLAAFRRPIAGFGNRHGQVWAYAPGLERQPRKVRGQHRRRPHHDRRLRTPRFRRGSPQNQAPATRPLHSLRRTPPAAWTASARRSTTGSGPVRTTCCRQLLPTGGNR